MYDKTSAIKEIDLRKKKERKKYAHFNILTYRLSRTSDFSNDKEFLERRAKEGRGRAFAFTITILVCAIEEILSLCKADNRVLPRCFDIGVFAPISREIRF